MALIQKWRKYWHITRASEIARRYFVMNSFDGVLTNVGLVTGMFVGGVTNPHIITIASVSTGIAIGLSGFWGAFLSESAERKHKLHRMERSLMRKLEDTEIERAGEFASKIVSLVDGLSPLLATIIVISPFFFAPIQQAYYYFYAVSAVFLFLLGLFLGKISGEDKLVYGAKMLLAGVIAAGASLLLLR